MKDHEGQTPLHKAACNGQVEMCQILMKNLNDKNPKDHDGQTPLHWAAWNGHLYVCRILRETLIDKNPKDNNGHTPYIPNYQDKGSSILKWRPGMQSVFN